MSDQTQPSRASDLSGAAPLERQPLETLENRGEFIHRHIGPTPAEISGMLEAVGATSLEELVDRAIPANIRAPQGCGLPAPRREREVLARARELASQNQVFRSLIGLGYSGTITPGVIQRNVLEDPGWYTAYTPYQAEISQGRMEALLNYQTVVSDLTGLDIANASLLDEATAAAEAMAMCRTVRAKHPGTAFWAAETLHPQTLEVLATRAAPRGIELRTGPLDEIPDDGSCFGVLLPYPDTFGRVPDLPALVERARRGDAMVVVATDLLALTLLESPGAAGADIAVGNSQRFGVPPGFGGPHAAFFATRDEHRRRVPGRIIGLSVDRSGRPALRLALQTREQHIRREKATSNICTAQVLLAVMAGMYAVYHGPEGLRRIALRTHRLTGLLARGVTELGLSLAHQQGEPAYFDTLAVAVGAARADAVLALAREARINLRRIDGDTVGVALDECSDRHEIVALLRIFADDASREFPLDVWERELGHGIPEALRRRTAFLEHPVFHEYHNETDMLRYLTRLRNKDLALDTAMIPLGSCTMKLNATTEMVPVTWPEFAGLHPLVPRDQAQGYRRLIDELSAQLRAITGFHAISLQPNAGSQGEYTGLLVIRRYHESRGQGQRDVCLIPSSAHGTNPASAASAGMKVVVVRCDEQGNIDVEDLLAKAAEHADRLAALMVTYPSTHGVFETGIREICQVVHEHGGQVYLDGANLNALVGLCKPGEFGPDVAHLNLHKTFAIPHGGGGPGVGPIGVVEHLAPFLPGHCLVSDAGPPTGIGAVAQAPWGSAGVLPISWAFIALMGEEGLRKATQVAILSANYVARRLAGHFDVLYTGPGGLVAHECILDLRPLEKAGVLVDDVAKRLMDFGFHAPTMSWPVHGTLMVEPTESEPKGELDRFCEAMIAIREEVRAIERGEFDAEDNPLKNAPHTVHDIAGEWPHPYSREQAVFPLPWVRERKFWPAVARVDNVHGDRNLVCSCPPLDAYEE